MDVHETEARDRVIPRIRQLVQSNFDTHLGATHGHQNDARRVNGHLRAMIADEQRYRCALCACLFSGGYHIDHRRPQYQGGTSNRSNLWALCLVCHGRKTALEQSLRVDATRATTVATDEMRASVTPHNATAPTSMQPTAHTSTPDPITDHVSRVEARRQVRLLADWEGPYVFGPYRVLW
jgi:5-methylcytosine-specific restriction endonuclease McrA